MKKTLLSIICALTILAPATAQAFNISDLFGSGSTVGNIIEGIFTKTNLTVADLQGSWTVNGAAVTFKGDNFLEKAGGLAAAAAVENKIDPYFKQYGLTGGVMTIDETGKASLKLKRGSLNGTFEAIDGKDYNFVFKVKVAGISVGTLPTYVEKSYANLNVMFDATKLKTLISAIASISGNQLAKAAGDILNQYEGMCVGFKMAGNGNTQSSSSTSSTQTQNQTNDSTTKNSTTITTGLGKLMDIFKKK